MKPPDTAKSSSFTRNVLVLMSGATLAQAVPLAASPVLTRLYTPEDFGILGLFVAVTTVVGSMATGRYEMAVMIADTDKDAFDLTILCFVIATGLSIATLIIVLALKEPIARLLGSPAIEQWLLLAPLTILLLGFFNALTYFNLRQKRFATVARATATKSFAAVVVQLLAGVASMRPAGLILGQVASGFASNERLLRPLMAAKGGRAIDASRMRQLGRRFVRFPLLGAPSVLANNAANQALTVLLAVFYSVSSVGYYALVQRAMGLPASLIGQSMSQAFFQSATEARAATGSARRVYRATTKRLVLIAVPGFGLAFLVAPAAFSFIFGEEWHVAGVYARVLAPLFLVRFVVVGVSTVANVFERQDVSLIWNVALLVINVATIAVSAALGLSVPEMLVVLSVTSGAHYVILWVLLDRVSGGTK